MCATAQVLSEHILSLCEELGVVTDVFSIGASSRFLAKNLISTVKDREPAEFGNKASIILIDRTLVSHSNNPQLTTITNRKLGIGRIRVTCMHLYRN